jgi:hypothetical protein
MSGASSRVIIVCQLPFWNKDMSVAGMCPRLVSGWHTPLEALFLYALQKIARQVRERQREGADAARMDGSSSAVERGIQDRYTR